MLLFCGNNYRITNTLINDCYDSEKGDHSIEKLSYKKWIWVLMSNSHLVRLYICKGLLCWVQENVLVNGNKCVPFTVYLKKMQFKLCDIIL